MAVAPLTVSNSSLKVMNAALAQLGVAPIASFSDQTIVARTGQALYADVVENALASYPWRFARQRVTLNALAGSAPKPWSNHFDFPSTAIALLQVYEDGAPVEFDRIGSVVVTNTSPTSTKPITAEITYAAPETQWAGYFRTALVMQLAAALAMPITQDAEIALGYEKKADGMMIRARSRDAQGRTPSRLDTKLFIRHRRTNGGR